MVEANVAKNNMDCRFLDQR